MSNFAKRTKRASEEIIYDEIHSEKSTKVLCKYCGYLAPDHEEKCLKSPETKAQLLINEHLKFNENENAAICHSLITVNMVKAVLPDGDLMAYYSRVRQILFNRLN